MLLLWLQLLLLIISYLVIVNKFHLRPLEATIEFAWGWVGWSVIGQVGIEIDGIKSHFRVTQLQLRLSLCCGLVLVFFTIKQIGVFNPHQAGVSESLIRRGGQICPPLVYDYRRVFSLFFLNRDHVLDVKGQNPKAQPSTLKIEAQRNF